MMKQRAQRRVRLEKAERPYWAECLDCNLSCENAIAKGAHPYTVLTCTKAHKSDPMFPYKYAQMKEEKEKEKER